MNARGARATGFDLEGTLPLGASVRGVFNYAYQNVVDSERQRVDFSPQHKANLQIQADLPGGLTGFLSAHLVGASVYHARGQAYPIAAYTRLDGRLGYAFRRHGEPWSVSVAVTNLLDDRHLEFPVTTKPKKTPLSASQPRTFWLQVSGKL